MTNEVTKIWFVLMLINFSNVLLHVILEATARNSINATLFEVETVIFSVTVLLMRGILFLVAFLLLVACFKHIIAKLKFML